MDIRQIQVFNAIAKHLSFTKAADELYLTQSSISKIIKSLEDELGMVLFYRSPRIQLTDVGQAFRNKTEQLLGLIESIPHEIQEIAALNQGVLRIGVPPLTGSTFFPEIVGEFRSLHPNIEMRIIQVRSSRIIQLMEERILDIGIVSTPPKDPENYHMMPFLNSPLEVGINLLNPLSDRSSLTLKDLKNEAFIMVHQDLSIYDMIMSRCQENHFIPNVICQSSQQDFIIEMVSANMGITLLPESITLKVHRPELQFIPLVDPPINLNLMVIWKKDSYQTATAKRWLSYAAAKVSYPIEFN